MPEYLKYRCCMCPNINENKNICPGVKCSPYSEPSECRFVKIYIDDRGWMYFVRSGLGQNNYKGFYVKAIEDYIAGHRHME